MSAIQIHRNELESARQMLLEYARCPVSEGLCYLRQLVGGPFDGHYIPVHGNLIEGDHIEWRIRSSGQELVVRYRVNERGQPKFTDIRAPQPGCAPTTYTKWEKVR